MNSLRKSKGDFLMKVGLDAFYTGEMTSRVIEITAEDVVTLQQKNEQLKPKSK